MKDIDLVAAHLTGDYILQSNFEAMNKLSDSKVRARHVTKYTLCFLPALLKGKRGVLFLSLVWITHFITDSKRWIPNKNWSPGSILNDQALHAIQIAILRRLL